MRQYIHHIPFFQCAFIIGMLIAAWAIEYTYHLVPCPICWIQRGLCLLLCLSFMCEWRFGLKRWSTSVIFLCIGLGILLTIHHQYLIAHYDPSSSCLPGFDYLLNTFGLFESLKIILTDHSSSCGNVEFEFLSLNLADWLLVCYAILLCSNVFKLIANHKRANPS